MIILKSAMAKKDFKSFYEKYHGKRYLPKRAIDEKNFTYRHIVATLNRFFKKPDILDIGSGVGTLDFYLASKGHNVTGIEISQKAVNIAKKSQEILDIKRKVKFIQGDFLKLKMGRPFTQIVCSEVLEHLDNDKLAIAKIYKLTKPGGLVIITVPSIHASLIKLGAIKGFDRRSGHLRRYAPETLKSRLEKANFKIIYSAKTEGILRNSLFVFRLGNPIIRVANRFGLVSDIITFLDNITLGLFGESQLIVVAKK